MPLWFRILLRFLLTIALVWAMHTYASAYIAITGGWMAYIIIAALVTLMNLLVMPIVDILLLPLRFLATAVAVVLVNGIFVYLTIRIVGMMNPALVTMHIKGGIIGCIVVMLLFGVAKWLMKVVLK